MAKKKAAVVEADVISVLQAQVASLQRRVDTLEHAAACSEDRESHAKKRTWLDILPFLSIGGGR